MQGQHRRALAQTREQVQVLALAQAVLAPRLSSLLLPSSCRRRCFPLSLSLRSQARRLCRGRCVALGGRGGLGRGRKEAQARMLVRAQEWEQAQAARLIMALAQAQVQLP